MSASTPGWYADPGGCWDERWWDGSVWANEVRTGKFESAEPYVPQPVSPDRSQVVWSGRSNVAKLGAEFYRLDWDAVCILDRRGAAKESIPIWGIRSIDVRTSAAQHVRGIGDVALSIGYPGYFGPSSFVLRGVNEPHLVKATIRRQIGLWNAFR